MIRWLFCLTFLIVLFATHYSYRHISNLSTLKNITKAKRITEVNIFVWLVVLVWIFYRLTHFLMFNSIFSATYFFLFAVVIKIGLFIVAISELWVLLKTRYKLSKPSCELLGNYYLVKHIEYLNENDVSSAEAAILKACEVNEQNAKVWLLRTSFTDYHLDNLEEAKRYLNIADNIIQHDTQQKKRLQAKYEFCLAHLLISENNLSEALVHLKTSQEIAYSEEKADFIKKVEANCR